MISIFGLILLLVIIFVAAGTGKPTTPKKEERMGKYKVWYCKIVIAGDSETPKGFDSPPRMAAQNAIENAGFRVISNFSGWGGKLDDNELEIVDRDFNRLKPG